MKREDSQELPPPNRREKRNLSLKTAMAAATKAETSVNRPLTNSAGNLPLSRHAEEPETEARLLELQADIINREELLAERQRKLHFQERELNEREALLEAHRNVLASTPPSASLKSDADAGEQAKKNSFELEALLKLKEELKSQEESIKEAWQSLHEREEYIESCENQLVEKSMLLTEREARIEQREEDHGAKTKLAEQNKNAEIDSAEKA